MNLFTKNLNEKKKNIYIYIYFFFWGGGGSGVSENSLQRIQGGGDLS